MVRAYQRIAEDFGRLDVQVNNAGILRDGLLVKVEEGRVVRTLSLEQWRAVIDVNLTGTFLCGREAASHMIRFAHGGVIINIASISRAGNFGQSNYSAAKAGVAALAVVWARELARYRIRAASIAPGIVRTEMMEALKPDALAKLVSAVPMQRFAEPAEIASARAVHRRERLLQRALSRARRWDAHVSTAAFAAARSTREFPSRSSCA